MVKNVLKRVAKILFSLALSPDAPRIPLDYFRLLRRNLKFQTRQIFSSRPREAKNSRKLNRTHDETAEMMSSRDSLLSSFLKCAALQALNGVRSWEHL